MYAFCISLIDNSQPKLQKIKYEYLHCKSNKLGGNETIIFFESLSPWRSLY